MNPTFVGVAKYRPAFSHDLMEVHSTSSFSLELELVHLDSLLREWFMAELAKHTPPDEQQP